MLSLLGVLPNGTRTLTLLFHTLEIHIIAKTHVGATAFCAPIFAAVWLKYALFGAQHAFSADQAAQNGNALSHLLKRLDS